jgi:hypothetical protein
MSYIKPQITPPSPLIFAILNGGSKTAGEFGGSGITTWKTRGKYSPSDLAGGRGDAWVRFGLAHFLQRLIVFWWFLQTYMTSGPCSSWFFLVMKRWFFWCYLGLHVMAILCRAAKNSLRGTHTWSLLPSSISYYTHDLQIRGHPRDLPRQLQNCLKG